jgi:uncharacterized protein YndB with AHSA1/START domain
VPRQQSETKVIEREIRVEAEPERVFSYFTDPAKMVRWMGATATLDPRQGGVFSFGTQPGFFILGEFVTVEPHRRLVFTWGYGAFPEDQENPLPPGSSIVEVDFLPDGEATIVHLTHRVPAPLVDFHTLGWEHYLARLAVAGAGEDPGPDPFVEFLDSMTGSE